jgi:hypothetical protein
MNVQQSPNHPRYATQTDAKSDAAGKEYLPASDSTNSGMACGSPVSQGPVKKVVDSRGSDPVKAAMDKIANPPCPREQMRGQRNSKHYDENGKAFKSTSDSSDSDAGN